MVYGSLADILYQWESLGVFDFILPFLLVFAIVFGVLSSIKIFGEKNKAVTTIIAVVIGLLSLRYQYFFSSFLSELFPRLGIGLAIMISLMILVGMFIARDETRYWGWGLAAIGAIIAIVIIYQAFDRMGYGFINSTSSEFIGFIVLGVLLVGVIIAVAASGSNKESNGTSDWLPWAHGGK